MAKTIGIANGQHDIAHRDIVSVGEFDGGQAWQVDVKDGQICFGVSTHHRRAG